MQSPLRPKLQGNARRDRETDSALAEAGWLVLRFWEHEVPQDVAEKVIAVVTERRLCRLPTPVQP